MKLLQIIPAFLLLLLPINITQAQSKHRENFRLDYWKEYVGSYRIELNRYVLIGLPWGGDLSYLDTRTGLFGRLKQSSGDTFIGEDGLQVTFIRTTKGQVGGLKWLKTGSPEQRADAVGLLFEEVKFPNGRVSLAGTLVLPPGGGPHPIIILNGGASWIVREQVMEDALFYASHGVAALIYDKRGWGDSTGETTVPFAASADDIVAIATHLKHNRTDINPKQIGISTYSQSGWYGTLAASRCRDIAFLILNVPSATTVYRQEFQRVEHELQADEFTEKEIQEALSFMHHMSQFSRTGRGWEEYEAAREQGKDAAWFKYVFAPKTKDPEAWQWGRMNWEYNPWAALEKITAPTLVILGGVDKKVLSEVNRAIFEMAFDAAGNRDYTIKIIPNINHSLVVAERGGRKEETPNRISVDLLSTRIAWLKEHVNPSN